jgi:hypothetical protein
VNIASALFGLSICDSGLQLNSTCNQLDTDSSAYQMFQSGYNPNEVKAIVCFCASNGYNFNTTRQDLYAELYNALFGVTEAAELPGVTPKICDDLSLFERVAPDLGIDVQQYEALVCGVNATTSSPTQSSTLAPSSYITGNMTTWRTPSSGDFTTSPIPTDAGVTSVNVSCDPRTHGGHLTHMLTSIQGTVGPPVSFTGTTESTSTPTGSEGLPESTASGSNLSFPTVHMQHVPRVRLHAAAIPTTKSGTGFFKRY